MTAYIYELEPEYAPWRWALAFDYSPEMVAAIKANIPSRERTWKPDLKQWWFKPGQLPSIEALARLHCGAVAYVRPDGDLEPPVPAEQAAAYRALYLVPGAPPELIKAAYRILAKQVHPDRGGTTTAMQRVNEAYGTLAARSKEQLANE